MALANINAGLLLVMAITSMEVYGVIIAGWASNSKCSWRTAASAQMVSYEIAMGFALVVVLMGRPAEPDRHRDGAGRGHVRGHGTEFLSWNWLPLLPIFVVYTIRRGGNQPPSV